MLALLPSYLGWHYTRGIASVVVVGGNMLWFTAHFFSVPLLLRTLLSPWKRMEDRGAEGDVEDFFASLLVNLLSRFIGFVIRLLVIAVGLIALCIGVVGFIAALVFWLLAPLLAVLSAIFGISLIFPYVT